MRRVATQTDAAQGRIDIHRAIGIIYGKRVILHPVGLLTAHHEVHELVDQLAANVRATDGDAALINLTEIAR